MSVSVLNILAKYIIFIQSHYWTAWRWIAFSLTKHSASAHTRVVSLVLHMIAVNIKIISDSDADALLVTKLRRN